MIIYLIIITLIILMDQWSKKAAFIFMKDRSYTVEKRFVILQTARNEGAILGLLRSRKKLLMTLIILMMIVLVYIFIVSLKDGYPRAAKLGISMVLGGAAGNLIDRARFKYVRDFFSFNFRKSPIFNIADVFIFFGAVIAVLFV